MIDEINRIKEIVHGGYLSSIVLRDSDGNAREYTGRIRVKRNERIAWSHDPKKDVAIVSLTRRRIFRRKK